MDLQQRVIVGAIAGLALALTRVHQNTRKNDNEIKKLKFESIKSMVYSNNYSTDQDLDIAIDLYYHQKYGYDDNIDQLIKDEVQRWKCDHNVK